jgi:DNA-binding response OmpR family regulator
MKKNRARVLLVDENSGIRDSLAALLAQADYDVRTAADGFQAELLLDEFVPDLVVLEVMVPHLSGPDLLRRLRARQIDAAVIVLTTHGDQETATAALEAGADDYITKPVHPREFVARIAAVLRRTRGQSLSGGEIVVGPVQLDLSAQTVTVGSHTARLSPTELSLLRMLMGAPGRVFPTDELLTRVWGPEYRGELGILRTSIYRLRRKLAGADFVRARQNAGYVFGVELPEDAGKPRVDAGRLRRRDA